MATEQSVSILTDMQQRAVVTTSLVILIVVALSQHCAKVNFTSSSSGSNSATINQPSEEPVEFQGNGTIYTGSVTYRVVDVENQCPSTDVIAEVVASEQEFHLVKEDCKEISPQLIPADDVFQKDDNYLVFDEYIFVEESSDFVEGVEEYPASCQEIFDTGRSIGNGYYYLAADGAGRTDVQFCNMEFIGKGWTPWSEWSECDKTCGGGNQTRSRECLTGNCQGSSAESRSCNNQGC